MRVIVIGAGIVGASAAYHLATQGADVVVVDRGDEGQATAAGAGIVFPWPFPGTPPAMTALGLGAAEHYPRLIGALEAAGLGDHGYAQVGGLTVGEDESALSELCEGLRRLRDMPGMSGLGHIERLAPGEPAERFGLLGPEVAGLWAGGVGRVDGRRLREALLAAATQRGAVQRSGSAAIALSGDRVTGVVIDGETVAADVVVAAAGAWSAALCEPFSAALPVFPQRGQILHVDLPGQETAAWPVVRTLDDHYMLAFPGGRIVAGATRESHAGFDYRVTVAGMHQIVSEALTIAPGLAGGTVAEVRVGFRPASTDGLPVLGAPDGVEGLVLATGLGPVGLTYGPYLGALAADLALGRDLEPDLAACRPSRRRAAYV